MSDLTQWISLISAIIGWATVMVGGLMSWTRLSNRITKAEGLLESNDQKHEKCQQEHEKRINDFESRLRALEHRSPDSRTRATDKGER